MASKRKQTKTAEADRSVGSSTQPSQSSRHQQAATSQASASTQPEGLAAYYKRKETLKQARVERGHRLAEQTRRSGGSRRHPQTKSQKAGLVFPVQDVLKKLKAANPGRVVRVDSAVMITGVMEYLSAELLELAGNCAGEFKKKRINPRHLFLAIKNDQELDTLLQGTTLSQGGVVPNIHPSLLQSKTKQAEIVRTQGEKAPAPVPAPSLKRSIARDDNDDDASSSKKSRN